MTNVFKLDTANDEAVAGTAPLSTVSKFTKIVCYTAGDVQLKAGGIFQYLAAVADGGTNTNTTFINPADGEPFEASDDDQPAGFYEGDGSQYVTLTLAAGEEINAHITSAKVPASDGGAFHLFM